MKQGKYFPIPEKPADVEQLWSDGEPRELAELPEWLRWDGADYRYLGSSSCANLAPPERDTYLADLQEAEAAGIIIDSDPVASRHHLYLPAPAVEDRWSIGIYVGEDPLNLHPAPTVLNPVLTRDSVSDVPAAFVADPFLLRAGTLWYMFFEVMNWRANKGEIAFATSEDGLHWCYQRVVLAEPFHLSYPYVFEWGEEYYMIPESHQSGAIHLYKARAFPDDWVLLETLLTGRAFADSSLLHLDSHWWLFTETSSQGAHETLRLYHAEQLVGPWREHALSPVVKQNPRAARCAGRILSMDNRVLRFAQDCYPCYGTAVRAFEIDQLTVTRFSEHEVRQKSEFRPSGEGWNASGMHHVDAHRLPNGGWIASVDGNCTSSPQSSSVIQEDGVDR